MMMGRERLPSLVRRGPNGLLQSFSVFHDTGNISDHFGFKAGSPVDASPRFLNNPDGQTWDRRLFSRML